MTKVECLKGILAKMKGVQVSTIQGNTVCEVLHQIIDYAKPIPSVGDSKFVVNVTASEVEGATVYSSDKTNAQILAAQTAGKIVEIRFGVYAVRPLMITAESCYSAFDIMSTSTTAQRTVINITSSTVGVTVINYTLDVITSAA